MGALLELLVAILAVGVEGVLQVFQVALLALGEIVASRAFLDLVAFLEDVFAVLVDVVAVLAFDLVVVDVLFMGEFHRRLAMLCEKGVVDLDDRGGQLDLGGG